MSQRVLPHYGVDVLHARVPGRDSARIVAACPARCAVGHDAQGHAAAHEVEQATDAANAAESNGVADNGQTEDAEGLNADSMERYSTEIQQSSDYDEVSANA